MPDSASGTACQSGTAPRSLTILQLFNRYRKPGGEETSAMRMAADLENGGHRVVQYWRSSEEWQQPGAPGKLEQGLLMWRNPEALEAIRHLHKKVRADLWLLHNVVPILSLDVYRLGRKLGVPLFQWLHNYRPFCVGGTLSLGGRMLAPDDPWLRWKEVWHGSWNGPLPTFLLALGYARLKRRRDFESVRAWVTVSDEMKRIFEQARWYPSRLHTCRHSWHAQPAPASCRDDGYFLYLGRMVDFKGAKFLLDLWSAPELRDVPLVMAGDGPLFEELKQRSPSNVRWTGHVEGDIKQELKAGCRAILFPSLWPEPLSTVAYEAYEMKKPLLASRAGGMAEVVTHERTGLLLPPGGRAAWLEAVLRLVREPERVREWGENGRRWLDEEVSPRRWLEQFNRIAHRAGVFEREPVCAG